MKRSIWAIFVLSIFLLLPSVTVSATTKQNRFILQSYGVDATSQNLYKEKTDAIAVFNNESKIYNISSKDVDLMAKVVYAESNTEPYEGKVAVASVILNRLKNNQFPKSVEGVIKQKYAFSCVVDGTVTASPDTSCYNAVFDALEGKDPTVHALFFYNPELSRSDWMNKIKKYNLKYIGKHVFFMTD